MKNIKTFILPLLISLLMSCSGSSKKYEDIRISSPTGAPSLAFYDFSDFKNFETNAVPSNVLANIRNDSDYDIVVAPTQGGIQAINREILENGHSDFKIASTITFGNFFVAGFNGRDLDGAISKDDKVVLFSQGEIPDKLFRLLYSNVIDDLDVYYVKNASEAASAVKTGSIIDEKGTTQVDYVLVAEPALSGALTANSNAFIYSDLQQLYKDKFSNQEITQASIFVNTKTNKAYLDNALAKIENDINLLLKDNSLLENGLNKFGEENYVKQIFGIPSIQLVKKVMKTNGMGLGYKKAIDNKLSIDTFLKNIAPKIGETNEEIYYK